MSKVVSLNMYQKPSERLILVALAKDNDCTFKYDEATGFVTVRGENAFAVREKYKAIVQVAYLNLAKVQANEKFTNVPIKTLTSEFMQAFAAMAYSIITGESFMFRSQTEVHRAGLSAVKL